MEYGHYDFLGVRKSVKHKVLHIITDQIKYKLILINYGKTKDELIMHHTRSQARSRDYILVVQNFKYHAKKKMVITYNF